METDNNIEVMNNEEMAKLFKTALNCDTEKFAKAYKKYKKAEEEWEQLYKPFKENLIQLYEKRSDLTNSLIIGVIKLTYVSPSVRHSIDSKKLKEEEPEIAKKFTKTTNVRATIRIDG